MYSQVFAQTIWHSLLPRYIPGVLTRNVTHKVNHINYSDRENVVLYFHNLVISDLVILFQVSDIIESGELSAICIWKIIWESRVLDGAFTSFVSLYCSYQWNIGKLYSYRWKVTTKEWKSRISISTTNYFTRVCEWSWLFSLSNGKSNTMINL